MKVFELLEIRLFLVKKKKRISAVRKKNRKRKMIRSDLNKVCLYIVKVASFKTS